MKVNAYVFLLLTPLCAWAFTPDIQIDSVSYNLNHADTDEEKVRILNTASSALADADLKRSFEYADQALTIAERIGDLPGKATALINLGKYYTRSGAFETAMQKYLAAMKISQDLGDHKSIALIYKIIGNGYYFQGDYSLALQHYRRALSMNATIRDIATTADLQNNIALIFIKQQKLDSALMFLTSASKIYEERKLDGKLANTFLNLGYVKEESGLHEEAITYYKKASEINRRLGLALQESVALNNTATSLIALHRYEEAKSQIDAANKIAIEQNFKSQVVNILQSYYLLAKQQNDLHSALTYHERLLELKDSLLTIDKVKQIEEVRTKYESEQTEKQNQKLTAEAALKESQLLLQRLWISFIAFFAVGVSLLALNYYRLMRRNKKTKDQLMLLNRQIHEQKEELTSQSEELSLANREILAMNLDLESRVKAKMSEIMEQHEKLIAYSYHNSHRVRGPLARILGLVLLLKAKAIRPDEVELIIESLSTASNELDTVIRQINIILQEDQVKQSTPDDVLS